MALNIRGQYDVTRTDRIHISDGKVPAQKYQLDRTCLLGAANTGVIGFTDGTTDSNDTIVIPRGSIVALNTNGQLTLPGARYDNSNVAISTNKVAPTSTTLCLPVGVVENDVIRYPEDVASTAAYPVGYKRSGDTEGAKAVWCSDFIELPIIEVSGSYGTVSVAPNTVKWGCVVTHDVDVVTPGVYLDTNGYGQFCPQTRASSDKGAAYGQVMFVWNATAKAARFQGALQHLTRRENYIMGQDGVPPIETAENAATLYNSNILDNDAFGATSAPTSYVTMARIRLLF